MKSLTTPDFWESYFKIPPDIKIRARKVYRLWIHEPRHPSLQFKKTGAVWSIRIANGYRALSLLQDGIYYWFWIGTHDEYDRLLKSF